MQTKIRLAHSCLPDARKAVREFHAGVTQREMGLVLFFCSSDYDLDILAEEARCLFAGVDVVGCTTAGEIGPGGYREQSLTGVSFSPDACMAVTTHIDHLHEFEISRGQTIGQRLLRDLEEKAPQANQQNSFALLLIDGLSVREEPVARALQNALGKVPLVGGSAGDGLKFRNTLIYVDGAFRTDSAAVILASTQFPFVAFKTQHFVPTDHRLVITEADTARRVVLEINGLPAAEEYARLLDVTVRDLSPGLFATSPVVVLIDGNNYVRSIQKMNADGSLTFFCAIEAGLVLRVARGVDLTENLENAFSDIRAQIGPPQLVIGCDCILRRLEIVNNRLEEKVANIFRRNNTIGFNTYGEQFRGVHVNQTLSGIAFGKSASGETDA
jgi:hypothetical protein